MSTFNDAINTRADNTGFRGLLNGISTRYAQYKLYRETLDELDSLSDRELADLGVARVSVRSIAYQAAYGN